MLFITVLLVDILFIINIFISSFMPVYFHFLSRGIILWIKLLWPENLVNTYAWHTVTMDSCFDLIRSHQQCILWSPPLEIEPVTTDYGAKTLQLSSSYHTQAQLLWLINLASLVCDMNCWLSCRISVLQSVVTGSISSGGDHSIHYWWDLIRSKQLSSVSVCCAWVFTGFSGHGNSIHNSFMASYVAF